MELYEIEDSLDSFIIHSKSPQELMMKLMLSGTQISGLDECVDFLIQRLFNGKVYDKDEKEKEFEDAVFGILSKIKKDELVNKYLISKSAYGAVIVDILSWMWSKMSFNSIGFVPSSPKLDKVIGLSKVMMNFDPDFIPSLRDKDGNNMMMIFAKVLNFDQASRLIHRAGVSSSNSSFDEYVKNRYGCSFFRSFIVDMKCDPYIKNSSGECFANFFSAEFLNCDLGYNQFNLKDLINLT
jgi:hypothetical protein